MNSLADTHPPPIYTIGHSTRTIETFVELLRAGQVELVVDIRSVPKSRRNPDYNLDELPAKLALFQIGHMHIAELGGLRAHDHDFGHPFSSKPVT